MGVTVNGAVLGQAGRVLAAVCLCWICAGEALAQGICAEVRLRISQEAVMTRSAFKATLELANNSSTATVDNAGVERSTPLLPAPDSRSVRARRTDAVPRHPPAEPSGAATRGILDRELPFESRAHSF